MKKAEVENSVLLSKFFLIFVMVFVSVAFIGTTAFSETSQWQSARSVIFKDGSVVHGKITQMNDETITIQEDDGNIVVRKFNDVSKFIGAENEPIVPTVKKAESKPIEPTLKKDESRKNSSSKVDTSGSLSEDYSGGYSSIYGGYAKPQDTNVSFKNAHISRDVPTQANGMLGMKFGYIFPTAKFISLEGQWDLILNNQIDSLYATGPGGTFKEDLSFTIFDVFFNFVLRFPIKPVHPYIGVGGGFALFYGNDKETETGYYGSEYDDYENTGAFAWQYFGGVSIDLSDKVFLDLSARHYESKPSFKYVDLSYKTEIYVLGIGFKY